MGYIRTLSYTAYKKSVKNDKTIDLQGFFYYNTRVRSLESEEHRLEKD